jgi:YHS domain-containing protein/thiol-disulfide isomerase/thioredoxin
MRTFYRGFGAFLLACCLSSLARGEAGVQWQSDLETAKRLAASSNRLVLIHFSATWCNPCKQLESQVFNKDSVARAIDANYVPVKLNVDQQPALARQYGVRAVPWDVIIMSDGQVVRDFQSPLIEQAYVGTMTEIAARYRPQPTALVAGVQAPTTATPVGYGAPAAASPAPSVANYAAAGAQPAAPVQGAPATNRWSDNRYADYAQQRQQPVADTISAPIANQVIGNPAAAIGSGPTGQSFGSTGASSQYAAPPSYQAPSFSAAGSGAPAASYPPDVSYPPQQAPNAAGAMIPGAAAPSANAAPNYSTPAYNAAPPAYNPPPQYGVNPPAPSAPPTTMFALEGYCPVHLMESGNWTKGDTKWGAVHRGKTYLFLSEQCQQRFLANPDRYAPAFDGNDPVLLVDRNQAVPGRREVGCYFGVEPNRRIVLFADETSYQTFSRNPQRYAAQIFATQR